MQNHRLIPLLSLFLFSGMLLVLSYVHVLNEQASFVDPKTIGTLVSVGLVLVVLVALVVGFFKCFKARRRRQSQQPEAPRTISLRPLNHYD